MDKKLISIFLVTIIVTFILTVCGATLIKSNDTSLKKSEDEISLDNKALASEGKLILKNNSMKNHSKKDEHLNDDNKKNNTSNTINNSSFKANNKSSGWVTL